MSTGPGRGVDGGMGQPYNRLLPAAPAIHGGTEDLAEEMTATINGTVRFNCEASGHPAPTVSWLWNDVPVVGGPRHQLLEGGTVLQVSVPPGRVAVRGGHGRHRVEGMGHPSLPKEGAALVLPGAEVPMGAPAGPQLRAALSGDLLPLCRWLRWRRVIPAATRAWPRTQLGQLRSTLPSPCRVRDPQ